MIKAGTVWKSGDRTCEFLRDVKPGDPAIPSSVLIDGEMPKFGDRIPQWMLHNGRNLYVNPPQGVEVIEPEDRRDG